jgi:hypothetical protein
MTFQNWNWNQPTLNYHKEVFNDVTIEIESSVVESNEAFVLNKRNV